MFDKFLALMLYLFNLLWFCSLPTLVPVNQVEDKTPYLGTWYFIAAAGGRMLDIHSFPFMDSTVFDLQEMTDNQTLLLTGAIRIGDKCVSKAWTYHLHPDKEYMDLEGQPDLRTLMWSGLWLNCSDCVILQETKMGDPEDRINRMMLYARNGSLSETVVKDFESKLSCLGMSEFFALPQKRDYCQYNGSV
ncbi:hypothetical protein GJAV_G00105880 [Gymnothorax javanicus]|nr:hypothetical protein GJAV_G00105880 [Gymnothorax javanicus]